MSPGALPWGVGSGVLVFQLVCCFHRYWAYSSKSTVWPKMESSFQDGAVLSVSSFTSKVMLKILQARLQQYMNHELPDVQAGFRKGRGTRNQIANIHWIIEKPKEFQKTSVSVLLTMPKPLTVWIITNVENSERDGNTRPPDLPLEKSVCRSESNLEQDMEQQTRSKLGKEYVKAVYCQYCHPSYLSYMQSTS